MRPRAFRAPLLACLLLLAALGLQPVHGQETLRIYFLDVGQGDAVLLEAPDGRHVLYDGGERGDSLLVLLEAAGVEELALVVASHPHADHIGGLDQAINHFRPPFILDSGLSHTTLTYGRYLEAIERAGTRLLEAEARTLSIGDVDLHILPPPGRPDWGLNDNSVGLRIEFDEFSTFLGGDAEGAQWEWWVQEYSHLLAPVQVMKASHHGSRNGDTEEGVGALAPKVVVVGVGGSNTYGHPHQAALEIYDAVGARVLRTDQDGTVLVEARPDGRFRIRTRALESGFPPPQ